jgi:hypothetical protein
VAQLGDAARLKRAGATRAGSSPASGTSDFGFWILEFGFWIVVIPCSSNGRTTVSEAVDWGSNP